MKAYLATIDYPYFIHTLYGSASNDTRTREWCSMKLYK
jgi:hypothetical protein